MNIPTLTSVYRQGNIVRQLGQSGKMALIVIACSLILAPAAQAFEAKLSGQVSRMVVAPDDAVGDEIQYQDIGWSGSRFRFRGTEKMDNGIEVGFRFEIQARNNPAGVVGVARKGRCAGSYRLHVRIRTATPDHIRQNVLPQTGTDDICQPVHLCAKQPRLSRDGHASVWPRAELSRRLSDEP